MIATHKHYHPFGMLMPGRTFDSEKYRFGFNGKENDDEVKGEGNSLDFGARIYDSRLGRWFSIDPYFAKYPSLSCYSAFGLSPLYYIDAGGETLRVSPAAKPLWDQFVANADKTMQAVIQTLDASDVFYNINYKEVSQNDPSKGGNTTWTSPNNPDPANQNITINIHPPSGSEAQNWAIPALADELTTALQFDRGDIGFEVTNKDEVEPVGYDYADEVATKVASIKAAEANGITTIPGSGGDYNDKIWKPSKGNPTDSDNKKWIKNYKSESGNGYKANIKDDFGSKGLSTRLPGYMLGDGRTDVQTAKNADLIQNYIYRTPSGNGGHKTVLGSAQREIK